MQLILYPLIIFVSAFLVQLFFIIKKAKNSTNIKIVIKLFVALLIATIIGIISFYGLGFAVLASLQEGR